MLFAANLRRTFVQVCHANAAALTNLMRPSAPVLPAARAMSSASAPKQQQPAALSGAALYGDEVPADHKEHIMGDVYCRVADRYDAVSDIISMSMNKRWKQRFVEQMRPQPGDKMIDVAGGTCEVAKRYLHYQDSVNRDRTSSVHVVDFNENMLEVGRRRLAASPWMRDRRVTFAQGNAEDLADVPDASVDIYCISAGMHNLPHPEKALSEAYRVLRAGGRFACLEYGHTDTPVIGQLCRWYWDSAIPFLGHVLARDRASYERLARSVRTFPHQAKFAQAIRDAGFHLPGKGYDLYQWGMMVAYIGTKPRA
ncbi:2-hexaprenyl-6-methoxy-1,4-benzoquinone methyltransferase [Coemansia sp. RSA 2706]|nr:2-hexaprenyl-6-methoxy-1,4-benzoquinone methyltransferase [Coemansia sp. RSA 2711]KAJ2298253.1 2-hexaprenyl-6-methoxy-1,4-benzoquinone methyltransferase [Coemansia sp. RSA 2706]KAJ2319913.1 2-hexaprenyl-6-methoxy-1,4-benzoquinone methyltransferase [Coemansia sp. RSA 2704]KAJ2363902.1 2-hexaprenyl-6-methoxy-1,4-benzoquinone methyltransferase [Coemansia sp. RSA 2610]KAJ2371625.1 2-hexaprenyl-6-methoxy-1,4-benzoquinone methyltransferase [Coemansia sp. RSA 2611]KAJ2739200.1 2-hexaprenyl-6-metho